MDVVNRIAACRDDTHRRRPAGWVGETVHRIKVPGHTDAESCARFFRQLEELGRKMPYNLVILPNGRIEQALPFNVYGWHARGYSLTHLGIACVGDFRTEDMPAEQYKALLDVLVWCSLNRGGIVDVFGHTEKKNATNNRHHECPGVRLNMDQLRNDILTEVQRQQDCPENPGFVLEE